MDPRDKRTQQQLTPASSIRLLPGIGRRTASLLEHTGIRTVAQLATMPDYFLVTTFGPSVRSVRRRAMVVVSTPPSHRLSVSGGVLASIGAWLLFRQLAR